MYHSMYILQSGFHSPSLSLLEPSRKGPSSINITSDLIKMSRQIIPVIISDNSKQ